ncbi:MAG: dienelactone hydrolase family protein [Curvibacter sp.]
MRCGILATLLLMPLALLAAPERVELPGVPAVGGHWHAAPGPQPRPAVVALHGCNGPYDSRGELNELQRRYAADLNAAGLHVLVLDSFSVRGVREICSLKSSRRPVTLADRRDDVGAALAWLAARPDVDATRLVLLGWSHGAQTVLAALDAGDPAVQARKVHPRAAVAFYPGCSGPQRSVNYRLQAPLLMLLGEKDDWTPVGPCVELHRRLSPYAPRFELVVYPDSHHAFDIGLSVRVRDNVGSTASGTATVGANPAAREASRTRMLAFLAELLN